MKRILLKLSGEVIKGTSDSGICYKTCRNLAQSVQSIVSQGIEVSLVIGGGNFFRGGTAEKLGMQRTPADHMGMIATLMNGLTLQHFFDEVQLSSRVLSGLECPRAVETYTWRSAMRYLSAGDTLIFVGGTGNPYFTTDSAAALRASEIKADALLKATKVDGVYTSDPMKDKDATRFDELSYSKVLEENLQVMDQTAFALCRENNIPIIVFKMDILLTGKPIDMELIKQSGTLVH